MKPSLLYPLAVLAGLSCSAFAAEPDGTPPEKPAPPPPLVVTRSAADLAAEGDKQLAAGQANKAIESYRAALEMEPKRHELRLKLAQTLAKAGRSTESGIEYERLNREHPDAATLMALIEARRHAGALVEAAMLAQKGLAADPTNEPLALLQADTLLQLKDPQGALSVLKVVKPSPRSAHLFARAHEATGQWGQAYTLYQALSPSPETKQAIQRMTSHAVKLQGLLVFAPRGWKPLPGSAALLNEASGSEVAIESHTGTTPKETAHAALAARIPEALRQGLDPDAQAVLNAKLQEHKSGGAGHKDVSPEELDRETARLAAPAVAIDTHTLADGASLACSKAGASAGDLGLPPPACALALPGQPLAFVLTGMAPEVAGETLLPLAGITIIRE